MADLDFTPDEERQLGKELAEARQRIEQRRNSASPVLAQNMAEFYRQFPGTNPDVLAPTVEAITSGRMSQDQGMKFLEDLTKRMAEQEAADKAAKKQKDKGWWERNISDKVKTGSRWAMAALNFVPQTVTNLASMGYEAGKGLKRDGLGGFADAWSTEGFMISTDLGTLLENDEVAGEGYFVGGRAAQAQAERARRFRGTIDGQAFTLGRGLARTFYQPGSREYRYLSGLVDATAAIVTPSVPGGKAVTSAIRAGAKTAGARAGLRTLAGLTDFESALIQPGKVNDFLNSRPGRSIISKMTEVKSIDEAVEVFPTADLTFLRNVAEITDEVQMRQFLNDSLGVGDSTRGIGPTSVEDINISRWDNMKRRLVQTESLPARLMSNMPGRHVVLAGGSDREKLQAVKNVKDYLRLARIGSDERVKLVDDFARALESDDGSMRNVVGQIENVIRTTFKDQPYMDDRLIDDMLDGIKTFKQTYDRALYGAISDTGRSSDFGGRFEAIIDGKVVTVNQPLNTAGLQSEMLKHSLMLPDPRQTRRLMSNLGWVTGKTGAFDATKRGELRLPLAALEFVQNEVWRPLTLLTGGYVLRNMADSLLRQSFNPNVKTGIFHPFEWIQVAMHRKFAGDIIGDTFKGDPETLLRNGQVELAEAAAGTLRESRDPLSRYSREQQTGVWKPVRRTQDPNTGEFFYDDGRDFFMQGVAAEVTLLATDEAARLVAAGDTLEDIVDALIADPKKTYVRNLQNRWKNRTLTTSAGEKTIGTIDFIDPAGNVNRANLENFVRQYISPRVDEVTGGDLRLKQIIANGEYTDELGEALPAFRYNDAGKVVGYEEDNFYRLIDQVLDDPNVSLKSQYKMQETVNMGGSRGSELREAWDQATNKFFAELYPKREAWLNRSPVFRQYYYKVIEDFADELQQSEVARLLNDLEQRLAKEGKKFKDEASARSAVGRYTGSPELANKLYDIKNGKIATQGKLTRTQLDAYAKGFALDETKRLFYNASEKSNFADIFRIIAPFGSAWAEVTKKWSGMLASDPEVLKRIGVTVQGLQEADPDGDGKGFFYKDPQTGEYMFNYPFSEQLAPFMSAVVGAITGGVLGGAKGIVAGGLGGLGIGSMIAPQLEGINAQFAAPVKSLSMGLTLLPGMGPYVQVAASKIIGDRPEADFIRKIIMPYGEPDVSFITLPAWADKVVQAITANPETDRIFGDLKIDTMKALAATGEYDMTTEEGKQRLEDDATSRARILLVLQGLGQFTGPTRPTPEFIVPTAQGDVLASELSKAWYELRAANFDTAVPEFLDTFGDDVILYMQSKTRTSVGGLDASTEFANWERANNDVFRKYPEIAGYFAPVGTELDYQAYVRQIETGQRERLTAQELLDEAQAKVGIAMYRSLVRKVGGRPNEQQEQMLREYRDKLGEQFPGFAERAIDVNAQRNQINKLYEAAFDSDLADNPIADATRVYLNYRDQALAAAAELGLTTLGGKRAAELRALLRRVGEDLAARVPEFERLWDRVLYNEVDVIA